MIKCISVGWFADEDNGAEIWKTFVEGVGDDGAQIRWSRVHTSLGSAKRIYFKMVKNFLGEPLNPADYGYRKD